MMPPLLGFWAVQRRGAHVPQDEDETPPYFDTFAVS